MFLWHCLVALVHCTILGWFCLHLHVLMAAASSSHGSNKAPLTNSHAVPHLPPEGKDDGPQIRIRHWKRNEIYQFLSQCIFPPHLWLPLRTPRTPAAPRSGASSRCSRRRRRVELRSPPAAPPPPPATPPASRCCAAAQRPPGAPCTVTKSAPQRSTTPLLPHPCVSR